MRAGNRSLSNIAFSLAGLVVAAPLLSQQLNPDSLHLFETKIRPVLATRCYGCHSAKAAKPQAGLLLDSQAGWKRGGASGAVIEPGDPDKSLLVRALRYRDKDLMMPPGGALPGEVVADFEDWIRLGAAMPADRIAAKPIDKRQ
jgi:hypothetical protein